LQEIDYNIFFSDVGQFYARVQTRDGKKEKYTLKEWQELGFDRHSVFADPMFLDPEKGDYRVKAESPALKLGFKNFDMDKRVKAESPALKLGFKNFDMDKFGLMPDFPKRWLDK